MRELRVAKTTGGRMRRLAKTVLGGLILLGTAVYGQTPRPTLKEALEWMHTAFPESESMTAFNFKQTRELNYVEGKEDAPPSCTITLVEHWKTDDGLGDHFIKSGQ
jgi:hypothetical protein